MTAKKPRPHRIEKRKTWAQYDKPGHLLAAASWPEGGTCIILDDMRIRTFYGPIVEALIAVGPVTAFWIREELVELRRDGDAFRTAPGDILVELNAALDGFASAAVEDVFDETYNAEVAALYVALRNARVALKAHMLATKPRPALKDALRALDAALVPFGELTANVAGVERILRDHLQDHLVVVHVGDKKGGARG